jgi:hypothetical protein
VNESLAALARQGINRWNTFVYDANEGGLRFWEHMGWYRLDGEYSTLQKRTGTEE